MKNTIKQVIFDKLSIPWSIFTRMAMLVRTDSRGDFFFISMSS